MKNTENNEIDLMIIKLKYLWQLQKEKAEIADKALEECEKLETQMSTLLKEMSERNPEEFEKFILTFETEIESEINE